MTVPPTQILPRRLTPEELARARSALEASALPADFVIDLGATSEDEAWEMLSHSLGMATIDLSAVEIDAAILNQFPSSLVHRHQVFPVGWRSETLLVATANPFDLHALDAVSARLRCPVEPVLARPDELSKLIKSRLGVGAETVDGLLAQRGDAADDVELLEEIAWDHSEAAQAAQQSSVVNLVNEILTEAVEARASDIHIEAQASGIKIRYRIDGVLQPQPAPPELNKFHAAIVSRLKIMAHLNIAERRVPQDGRIKLKVSRREVDIRVSIIPMLYGESIVMRILDKERMQFSLRGIGMDEETDRAFRRLIALPHGIVLVTGPTGSGKTTTLYSALNEIRDEETKIITTEDPIEYHLDGINQIQVNAKVGLTFAASLRSILRHDPDVVLVGEIRDFETAENAIQASLTGHLVFSTLHTNDAAGAFTRLVDMGVEPFLVSSTVEGVLAQRLVRTLCRECRAPCEPDHRSLPEDFPHEALRALGTPVFQAKGCRQCRGTGYVGRTGLYELLVVDDEVRRLAGERLPSNVVKQAAMRNGLRTLRQDGWRHVLSGRTTLDEVLRVTKCD
ncbi:MAG: general secretion pathway protein GspE [Planctomycetota bacterium]|nr:MAG: general secretion pathway protein GspE [Planctomycetota bacterium]